MTREKELARKGWQRQTTYDEPRLSEIITMYEKIGKEVRLEPFNPSEEPGCTDCMKTMTDRYKTVYTRSSE